MAVRRIKATIPQGRFLSMPHKFRAFVAGYGSGKSYVAAMSSCINYAKFPGVNQGYFAPTYPQIRDIFFPTIEEVAERFGFNANVKLGNKEVHFYSGKRYLGTTICRSMDNPGSIVGFKIGHAIIDELDTLPTKKAEDSWRKIIARMRYNIKGIKNGIDVATTPEGFRFTHKMFVETLEEKPELSKNYGLLHASTYDNEKNLPADYIPSLLEAYPEQLIDAYLNGKFVNLQAGTVFYAFDRKNCYSDEVVMTGEPLYVGMDFNVQHMAASVYVQRGEVWHLVEEVKEVFDTPDMIRILQERYPKNSIIVYPDASGGSRKSVDASISDLALLRQARFTVRARKTNPAVKDRILAMNKGLEKGLVKINIKTAPTAAKCLEKQAYDDNGEPDKKSGYDHQNDASSYPIAYEMPINKPSIITGIKMGM